MIITLVVMALVVLVFGGLCCYEVYMITKEHTSPDEPWVQPQPRYTDAGQEMWER